MLQVHFSGSVYCITGLAGKKYVFIQFIDMISINVQYLQLSIKLVFSIFLLCQEKLCVCNYTPFKVQHNYYIR